MKASLRESGRAFLATIATISIGFWLFAPSAWAQQPAHPDAVPAAAANALFEVFALALLLESGLALVFNWRPFVIVFDRRGVKTPIAVAVAWTVAAMIHLDVIAQINAAYTGVAHATPTIPGYFITSLILAGGSGAMNTILQKLGLRDATHAEDVVPRPAPNQAWIAIALVRNQAVGLVDVFVDSGGQGPRLAGTLEAVNTLPRVWRFLFKDRSRFPESGGYAVTPGQPCSVSIRGRSKSGQALSANWGPEILADRAIKDIPLEL